MDVLQEHDIGEIEAVLREHRGVREAAVAITESTPGDRRLIACVVPDYDCIVRDLAGSEEERKGVLQTGRLFDLTVKARKAGSTQAGSNFLGWNSSYTKQPIPEEQMQEWVDLTVEDILRLRPIEALEIGCGSGLLLLRIARGCQRYTGIDVSSVSLQAIGKQMEEMEGPWDAVKLLERPADDFSSMADDSFDTAIINSVTQYFPNTAYLIRVLKGAAKTVRPGGAIFIGDVRSLPLMETMAVSVELHQAQPTASLKELREGVKKRVRQDRGLTVSPLFFTAFQQRCPKVCQVEIKLKRGQYRNEMNSFRYDVILHLGTDREQGAEPAWLDAGERNLTLDAIRELLQAEPGMLGIMRVPNARIEGDVEALSRLSSADVIATVAKFKEDLRQVQTRGIDPAALSALGGELGYQVDMSWASSRIDGSYEVLFRRLSASGEPRSSAVAWPHPEIIGGELSRYVNRPGQHILRQSLVSELNAHCKRRLAAHLVPGEIVVVDEGINRAELDSADTILARAEAR